MAVLKTIHLDLPAHAGDLRNLEIGSVAYLTGRVFTAREGRLQARDRGRRRDAGRERRARPRQFPLLAGGIRQFRWQPHGRRRHRDRILSVRQVARWLVPSYPAVTSSSARAG